jgi:hypothetical protein
MILLNANGKRCDQDVSLKSLNMVFIGAALKISKNCEPVLELSCLKP